MAEFVDGLMAIDGELRESASGEWMDSIEPATEERIGRVPNGDETDVRDAVAAAHRAFPEWRALSTAERAGYMRRLCARIAQEQERLTDIEVRDTGNTIRKMQFDVSKSIEMLEYYAGLGTEVKGETVPATANGLHFSVREPYGVIGRIVPFNHPFAFAAGKMGAALITGNTVVTKPSDQSPLSATILGQLCNEVLPRGVVNIVTGTGDRVGSAISRHPQVRRIAFIGSVRTGMRIQQEAAGVAVKNVTLELGGKNPMIVFPDADLDAALPAAIAGMNFAWSGQSCGSMSRLFLHESIYERGVETIKGVVESLRVGDPLDHWSDMGPVNSEAHYHRVLDHIQVGIDSGARLVTGGRSLRGDRFDKGYWIAPTVFADVKPDMRLFQEEIFGPVLSIVPWSDPEQVVEMANDVEYGLTASVWTRDLGQAMSAVRRIDAGFMWVNDVSKHYLGCGFGGVKNSGLGREEGLDELYSYTESKFVHVNA